MSKIYLPNEYLNKTCYQVNNGYIRVWETNNYNQDNNYYDIYINQDYQVKKGTSYFYNTIQTCDNINTYTSDFWYRLDIDRILIIFLILSIFILLFPYKIFSRFFGKWARL